MPFLEGNSVLIDTRLQLLFTKYLGYRDPAPIVKSNDKPVTDLFPPRSRLMARRSAACYDRNILNAWKDNLRVVLVATRNPLNIGAAARAMANFGFSRLRVVEPYDVAFREARSAVGAAPLLERGRRVFERGRRGGRLRRWWWAPLPWAIASCSIRCAAWNMARGSSAPAASAPVALLFGSEKFGLSNEDLSHCHWLMRIPTVDRDLSMNLGQAVALCLYELVARS